MLKCSRAILTVVALTFVSSGPARADLAIQGSFGPNGYLGFVNSFPTLSITFGASGNGSISQMDGFVNASSDDGTALPGFSITQHDPVFTGDTLTVSGAVASVPEPSSLVMAGLVVLGSIAVKMKLVRNRETSETIVRVFGKK